MRLEFSVGRGRIALLLTVLLALHTPLLQAQSTGVPDVLQRPAKPLKDATHSVQLAIARAGSRLVSVGEKGLILISDDAGHSWRQAQQVPVSVTLTDIHFIDDDRGFAIGHSGVLLTTSDHGEHWQLKFDGRDIAQLYLEQAQALPESELKERALREAQYLVQDGADKPLLHLSFRDARNGLALGAYGLALKTHDGGETWSPFSLDIPNDGGMHLYGSSTAAGETYLAGERGSLFLSPPATATFSPLDSPYNGSYFGVLALKQGDVLLFGLRGNLWRYSATAGDWTQLPYPYEISITSAVPTADGRSVILADANGNVGQLSLASPHALSTLYSIGSYITDLMLVDEGLVASTVRGNKLIEASF